MYNLDDILGKLNEAKELTENANKRLAEMKKARADSVYEKYSQIIPSVRKLIQIMDTLDNHHICEIKIGKWDVFVGQSMGGYRGIAVGTTGCSGLFFNPSIYCDTVSARQRISQRLDWYNEAVTMLTNNFDIITEKTVKDIADRMQERAAKINSAIRDEEAKAK